MANKSSTTLSDESIHILDSIANEVEIFVAYEHQTDADDQIFVQPVKKLLQEYRAHCQKFIKTTFIDINKQPRQIDLLRNRFGEIDGNSVVISQSDRFKIITAFELYDFSNENDTIFCAEEVISNYLAALTSGNKKSIVFTVGHGEMSIDNPSASNGISSAVSSLKKHGYDVLTKHIADINNSSDDLNLIVIAGPRTEFIDTEVDALEDFLSHKNGKLLILLSPLKHNGLDDLFFRWGIIADDMTLVSKDPADSANNGDNMVRIFADHPITKAMTGMQLTAIFGATQPARPDLGANTSQLVITPLLESSVNTFAKLNFDKDQNDRNFDPNTDLPGPIPLATLSERMLNKSTGIDISRGKLLVVGNCNFISNSRIHLLGNRILFNSMVNWLTNDNQSLRIQPRILKQYMANLSKGDILSIALWIALLPFVIILGGIYVCFVRRK
ncbi:MAG: GldG family protein [Puniceicoccales bacterium]|nr:GldG family protein [Puniceicoccales bacterium]